MSTWDKVEGVDISETLSASCIGGVQASMVSCSTEMQAHGEAYILCEGVKCKGLQVMLKLHVVPEARVRL